MTKPHRPTGPSPTRLALEGPWEDRVADMLKAGRGNAAPKPPKSRAVAKGKPKPKPSKARRKAR